MAVADGLRDGFVRALDAYLTQVGADPDDAPAVAAAQTRVAAAFSALRDEVVERTGWSLPLEDGADPDEGDDPTEASGAGHEVRVHLRPTNPKRLRKLLAARLREEGFDKADLARMGPGDLLGEVAHGLVARLADVVEDTAEITVSVTEAGS